MGYEEAISHLDALGIDAMKSMRPSTGRIEAICAALDHPERAAPALHITGTNGKTSTARIAASLLAATGLSVGTYTSPHLQTIRERIALNGEPISEEEFGEAFDHLEPYIEMVETELGEGLTYFEVLTAMFYLWAAEKPVDAMVVEVGLGGRYDATNVVPSEVAVITNVGLDHTGLLGTQRETIADEKSGIIKQGAVAVTGERSPTVVEVIAAEADKAGAELVLMDRDFGVRENRIAVGGRYLGIRTSRRDYDGLFLPLHGSHQGINAALALEATSRFLKVPLDADVVLEGFGKTAVPGRFETLRLEGDDAIPVILDVAHNPDGMAALVNSLVEAFVFERAVCVVGILADKDYRGMLSELARVPCAIVATRPENVRAIEVAQIQSAARELGMECTAIAEVGAAVDHALSVAQGGELVCITGSHYVAGEARSHLL